MRAPYFTLSLTLLTIVLVSCQATQPAPSDPKPQAQQIEREPADAPPQTLALATFAGGCFWCMEPPFEKLAGVHAVISGYSGGEVANPTYKEVSGGGTGHREAVQITYDSAIISYDELLDVFWRQINPTDAGGQFVDRGFQYTSAIFYHDDEQQRLAEASKAALDASGRYDAAIVTPVVPFRVFYEAEDYHQDYYKTRPIRYKYYRNGSGRDKYLDSIWGEGSEE